MGSETLLNRLTVFFFSLPAPVSLFAMTYSLRREEWLMGALWMFASVLSIWLAHTIWRVLQ